jgi:hypothetical protein
MPVVIPGSCASDQVEPLSLEVKTLTKSIAA